jgi:hypothetical protein
MFNRGCFFLTFPGVGSIHSEMGCLPGKFLYVAFGFKFLHIESAGKRSFVRYAL